MMRTAILLLAVAAASATDPDVGKTMVEIVEERGYPIEEHYVQTEDGYILGVFRIPHGRSGAGNEERPVAFLQHGLLDSSYTWVNNFADESLAYLLADAGWDVWMGNSRGNTWSKAHVSLPVDSEKFWDFSWDQMARYDLPAMISYALDNTGASTLSYVGHSQGTIQAFAAFSRNQTLAAQVNYFAALAPVAYVDHTTVGTIHAMADLDVGKILNFFGTKQFLPSTKLLEDLGVDFCKTFPSGCGDILFWLAGPTKDINETRMDVYLSQTPAGTSVHNMIHWSQGVKDNAFQMYDYGCGLFSCGNKDHYGQRTPPAYDLTQVTLPTGLYSGGQDKLADPRDVERIRSALPNLQHDLYVDDFAHLDFTWGEHANTKVYAPLMQHMKDAYHAATDSLGGSVNVATA